MDGSSDLVDRRPPFGPLRQRKANSTQRRQCSRRGRAFSHDSAEALRELARVKLDEITAGRLVRGLDAAEPRALSVLEHRRLKLSSLHTQHEIAVGEVAAAESERNDAAGAVEAAVEVVDECGSRAEARAPLASAMGEARSRSMLPAGIAEEADKKAKQSTAELAAKQKPYDSDPLFAYLWAPISDIAVGRRRSSPYVDG